MAMIRLDTIDVRYTTSMMARTKGTEKQHCGDGACHGLKLEFLDASHQLITGHNHRAGRH